MRDGLGPGRSRGMTLALVSAIASLALSGCVAASAPPSGRDAATGFPFGVYSKEMTDPDLGRVRLDWIFGPDGRWAEVPIPLDGQPQRSPVVRGTYRVEGDLVTIATTWPPRWGTSEHRWWVDGDDLWTAFRASDVPGDAAWFAGLDSRPWRPPS